MKPSDSLAQILLDIGAVRINPENPFTWASGSRMPVYNDNRLLLADANHRNQVARMMLSVVNDNHIAVNAVAGIATGGIPHATSLANLLNTSLVYVRPTPKTHGTQSQVEGILKRNQNVLVVEDLVSTGGSSLRAIAALRQQGARVDHCLSIFNYGFPAAMEAFQKASCTLHSLLNFEDLLHYAETSGRINSNQKSVLQDWYPDPFGWASRHGFSAS